MLLDNKKVGNLIKIDNIDSKIWNFEYRAIDMLKEYQSRGSINIDLNTEGPDLYESGLYQFLDYACNAFDIDKSKITITTRNLVESHPEYNIRILEPIMRQRTQTQLANYKCPDKEFNNDFKTFGLFIGRSNWRRLWISSEMYYRYPDQTLQTFLYNPRSDFHKAHLGVEPMLDIVGNNCNMTAVAKLIDNSPLELEPVDAFPILDPANLEIVHHYKNFFVEIVCETFCSGNTFFPTEKIWRPIVCKTPFLLQGPQHYLRRLRSIGFRTFDQWWNEGYDEDGTVSATMNILDTVERLSRLTPMELKDMYSEMKETVDHNYNLFFSLQNEIIQTKYE